MLTVYDGRTRLGLIREEDVSIGMGTAPQIGVQSGLRRNFDDDPGHADAAVVEEAVEGRPALQHELVGADRVSSPRAACRATTNGLPQRSESLSVPT